LLQELDEGSLEYPNDRSDSSRSHYDASRGRDAAHTSREKAIPSAPKLLIPGAFWFASDLHAGGNAYHWRMF
jgi:hypothetical protein